MIQLTQFLFPDISRLLYSSYTYITFHTTVFLATKMSAGQWRIGLGSRQGKSCLSSLQYRQALFPFQQVSQFFPRSVKRPGLEAENSLPSSTEDKNAWSYTTTHTPS